MVQRDDASLACWQCGFDSRRVHSLRRVAGYGLPGRFAKPCGLKAVRVQLPCLPLKLEQLGLVTREPGVARSVRVAIPEEQIPELEDVEGPPW